MADKHDQLSTFYRKLLLLRHFQNSVTESYTDPPAVPPTNWVGEALGKSEGR